MSKFENFSTNELCNTLVVMGSLARKLDLVQQNLEDISDQLDVIETNYHVMLSFEFTDVNNACCSLYNIGKEIAQILLSRYETDCDSVCINQCLIENLAKDTEQSLCLLRDIMTFKTQ